MVRIGNDLGVPPAPPSPLVLASVFAFGCLFGAWIFFDTRGAVSTIFLFLRDRQPSARAFKILRVVGAVVAVSSLLEVVIALIHLAQ
jgi:hypothetical protein